MIETDIAILYMTKITAAGTFDIKSGETFLNTRLLETMRKDARRLDEDDVEPLIEILIGSEYWHTIDFSWNVTTVTSNKITFTLDFDNPEQISSDPDIKHFLKVKLLDIYAFSSRYGVVDED